MRKTVCFAGVAALSVIAGSALAEEMRDGAAGKAKAVEAEPSLQVPSVDYRREWVELGTFSVLSDKPEEGAKQLHVTYAERKAVEEYLKSGRFPDGTVLIKDVFAAKTEPLTTGTVSYPGDLAGRFVMVKDEKGALAKGSPRFGDGWGWAFFEGPETKLTVTSDYKTDCLTCHEPARSTDLLYTRGYPVLRK